MADEPRIRRGGWATPALIVVALVVFAVVNAASRGAGDRRPDPRVATSTPRATPDAGSLDVGGRSIPGIRLAPRTVRGVGPHCERTTCCPTEVLSYATSA